LRFKITGHGDINMNKIIIKLILAASLLGFQIQVDAIELNGEKKATSHVYQASKSAVEKTMKKMGIKFEVDGDGDFHYKMDDKGWNVYVIFNHSKSGKLWNIQMMAQFATKKSRYDELVEYANAWNAKRRHPKVSMKDRDSLRMSLNYPVQYGFNPDEFEDNVIGTFERTLKIVVGETEAMRN